MITSKQLHKRTMELIEIVDDYLDMLDDCVNDSEMEYITDEMAKNVKFNER